MNWLNPTIEVIATITEMAVIFSAISMLSDDGNPVKRNVAFWRFGGSILFLTLTISILNRFQIFSFLTILISVFLTLILSKIITKQPFIICGLITIICYLAVHAVDYIVLFALGTIVEAPVQDYFSFSSLMNPGPIRICYLLIDKGVDVLLYLLLHKHIGKLKDLGRRSCIFILMVSVATYAMMTVMLSLIFENSLVAMQLAVIVAWVFMILCVFMTTGIFLISSNYQKEKEAYRLLRLINSMMEQNYRNLHSFQNESAKRNHDVNHHLKALRELAVQDKSQQIKEYVDDLLKVSYAEAVLCHSGNDVIDAIINSKLEEAEQMHIRFDYQVNFSLKTDIKPVDICAILANQIDNAFDACALIEDKAEREVQVHVWQESGNIAMFQVKNRVIRDPFENNQNLRSTKTDNSRPHGLGIKSIQDTAKKYNGMLQNTYQDGEFISTAFLNFKVLPFSQKNKNILDKGEWPDAE